MLFRILLWAIGLLLAVASRTSARVRAQLARDLIMVLETGDGVARRYVIRGRRISSYAGSDGGARCTLRFRTAALGMRILLAPDAIDRIVEAMGSGDVECDGEAALVLWFYELIMGLNPLRAKPRDQWPNSYTEHDPKSKVADRITREPAVSSLPPGAQVAHRRREQVLLWQVGLGAEPAGKFRRHKIVVDVPPVDEAASPS